MSCECYECLNKISPITAVIGGKQVQIQRTIIMSLCTECGNKRCPKATDHRLACTGSNEPGQLGSRYGVYPHPSIELIDFIEKGSKN